MINMLTNKEIRNIQVQLWVCSFIFVIIGYLIYQGFDWWLDNSLFPNIKKNNISVLVGLVTTFSITMTGFIAAIGAYTLSISRSPNFTEWRNAGYLSIFYHLYAVSIVFLLLTFLLCIVVLLIGLKLFLIKVILLCVLLNIIHIACLAYAVINQSKKADNPHC
jgi:hypothetical protein